GMEKDATSVPSIVYEVLHSPGQPLDAAYRASMETLFGHDFSRVRVHTNSMPAESARSVNALAYTVGSHIVFGANRFSPATTQGTGLLAHELAHVVQQKSMQIPSTVAMGKTEEPQEREAENAARSATAGLPAPIARDSVSVL